MWTLCRWTGCYRDHPESCHIDPLLFEYLSTFAYIILDQVHCLGGYDHSCNCEFWLASAAPCLFIHTTRHSLASCLATHFHFWRWFNTQVISTISASSSSRWKFTSTPSARCPQFMPRSPPPSLLLVMFKLFLSPPSTVFLWKDTNALEAENIATQLKSEWPRLYSLYWSWEALIRICSPRLCLGSLKQSVSRSCHLHDAYHLYDFTRNSCNNQLTSITLMTRLKPTRRWQLRKQIHVWFLPWSKRFAFRGWGNSWPPSTDT